MKPKTKEKKKEKREGETREFGRLGANFYGVREKRGGRVVDLRI